MAAVVVDVLVVLFLAPVVLVLGVACVPALLGTVVVTLVVGALGLLVLGNIMVAAQVVAVDESTQAAITVGAMALALLEVAVIAYVAQCGAGWARDTSPKGTRRRTCTR